MKALKTLKAAYDSAKVRAITAAVGALTAPSAFAITKTDLTQDTSGGKTASDVMTNIDDTAQGGATLLIWLMRRGEATRTAVSKLSPAQRVEEIARMLGGVDLTEESLAHARQMVGSAQA